MIAAHANTLVSSEHLSHWPRIRKFPAVQSCNIDGGGGSLDAHGQHKNVCVDYLHVEGAGSCGSHALIDYWCQRVGYLHVISQRRRLACQQPEAVVLAILQAHPDAAREKGLDGWLPLHWAPARQHPGAVALAILEAHPDAHHTRFLAVSALVL